MKVGATSGPQPGELPEEPETGAAAVAAQGPAPAAAAPAGESAFARMSRTLAAQASVEWDRLVGPAEATAPDATADAATLSAVQTALAGVPKRTSTAAGIAGDPVNIAFVGSASDLARSLGASSWTAAGAGLKADLQYVGDLIERKIDGNAPVSDLDLGGRKQDLAFEIADSTKTRHHVRFWKVGETPDGRDIWAGAATRDCGVGLKKNYGAALETGVKTHHVAPWLLSPVTHQIDPAVDAERDKLAGDLGAAGGRELGSIGGMGATTQAKNGDGYPFSTDGSVRVIVADA